MGGTVIGDANAVSRPKGRSAWPTLVLFGAVVLAALPFYGPQEVRARSAGIFWVVAVPAAYLFSLAFSWWIRRRQVGISAWFYLAAAAVFVFLVDVSLWGLVDASPSGGSYSLSMAMPFRAPRWIVQQEIRVPTLFLRGVAPLLVIAIAIFVLARFQRSWALAGAATAFLGLALLANLYNISNVFLRLHLSVPDWAANLAVAGGFLVFAGLVALLLTRREARASS